MNDNAPKFLVPDVDGNSFSDISYIYFKFQFMGAADKIVNKAYYPFWINQPENHISASLDLNK